jgi:hypothetical protein
MDAKIPFSTFDPSLPMSAYEGYNMTDNPFGESAPNGAPREFLPNWDDFLYDQGMGALDTSDLPPLPLLEQGQPASFLGNDRALPLYNTGTQFPFPNQDDADLAQLSLPLLSDPQGECGTDGLTKTTRSSSRDLEKNKPDAASKMSTPKKRKPRKKKNPPSEKEQKEKKEKFLERNRKAAQKCREKKKGWVEGLAERCARLQRNNDLLNFERAEMAKQLAICKQLLAPHAACGVPAINDWVHNMSRSVSIAMDRNLSSQSRTSQNSSSSVQKNDSGISNMGTPPDERRNAKQLHEDEGFGGASHFGPGEQYAAQAKVPTSHNPLVGPLADLQDPAEFFASIVVQRTI